MDQATAQKTINRLRKNYQSLIASGYTQQNAFDRLVHDNGDIPLALLAYAGDRALTGDDICELGKCGISVQTKNKQTCYTMDEARTETGYRLYHNYDWDSQEDARRAFDGYTRQCNDNVTFTSDEIDTICSDLNDAAKTENDEMKNT